MSKSLSVSGVFMSHNIQLAIYLSPCTNMKQAHSLTHTNTALPTENQTHSTVYSCSPTGMQKTNWMALQRRWNSEHLSTFITPLDGGAPCHTGSSRKVLMRVSRISNMERPQHRRSLVNRSPSAAMSACWGRQSYIASLPAVWPCHKNNPSSLNTHSSL